jgi:hypothetical protein
LGSDCISTTRGGTASGPAIWAISRAARSRFAGFFERRALFALSILLFRSSQAFCSSSAFLICSSVTAAPAAMSFSSLSMFSLSWVTLRPAAAALSAYA